MRVLAVSDKVEPILYSSGIADRVGEVDCILSCGDLPYYYIEYLMTMLGKPTYYVYGNHGREVQYSSGRGDDWNQATGPMGAINMHLRTRREGSLLLAGLDGSVRYNEGQGAQHTQSQMWANLYKLTPALLRNRARHGRYLDVLMTHAPPWGIHDKDDLPHQGFTSYLSFMRWFKPRYLLHGHIHLYRHDEVTRTRYLQTEVINVYPFRLLELEPGPAPSHSSAATGEPPDAVAEGRPGAATRKAHP